MIKNLLIQSMESSEKRGKLNLYSKKRDSDDEEMVDSEEQAQMEAAQLAFSQTAKQVLIDNVNLIGSGIHAFWSTHQLKLRRALLEKQKRPQK